MSAHTPAPWHAPVVLDGDGHHAVRCNGHVLATVARLAPAGVDDIEGCTNARLIAAAPLLLEALVAWRDHLDGEPGGDNDTPEHEAKLMDNMRAAIRAAEGAQP